MGLHERSEHGIGLECRIDDGRVDAEIQPLTDPLFDFLDIHAGGRLDGGGRQIGGTH